MMELKEVKKLFEANGVTSALVVDDFYDDITSYEEDDLSRAYQLIERDDDVQTALVAAGLEIPTDVADLAAKLQSPSQITNVLNASLRQDDDAHLRKLARAIFGKNADDHIARGEPLDNLKKLLDDLGVSSFPVGSDGPGKDDPKHPLIFMDYYLGPKGTPAMKKSIERVKDIVSRYPHNERPIVVLMSSELAKRKTAYEFRDDSELLGSQFEFVMKEKFGKDGFSFVTALADLVEFIAQARILGSFVDAWRGALIDSASDFIRSVRTLDIQDYFHLKASLGSGAEHRFGDHMSNVFSGYLRKLLEDQADIRTATETINSLTLEGIPPVPFSPSETVSTIAHSLSFQDIPNKPLEIDGRLRIELGDVFLREYIKSKKRITEVSIVVTQDCDLEHGKTDTVFMIDGTVSKQSPRKIASESADRHALLRVDLFHYDGENYTIEWDARKLRTISFGSFQREVLDLGFSRVARLRTVQALALQQKFAAHIARVAMPDTMPVYRFTNAEIWIRDGKGKRKLEDASWKHKDRWTCVVGAGGSEVKITMEAFDRIREHLASTDPTGLDADQLKAAQDALGNIEALRKLRNIKLVEGRAEVANIGIKDGDAAMAKGEAIPAGVWLLIYLHP